MVLGRIRAGLARVFATPEPQLGELDYDAYWDAREADVFQPRFAVIARMIPPDVAVADVGCGDGSLLRHLVGARRVEGWGTDISERAVALARERGTVADVGDITDPGFRLPRRFDYVVISEVLEHIADPESVLLRLRDQIGRRLIVTLPNTGYLEHRLRLLFGRFPVQWMLHPGEHLRFWTLTDFHATAQYTGYRVVAVRPALGWFPFARAMPSLLASQLVYELEPRVAG